MAFKFNPFISNFDIDNTEDAYPYYIIASGLTNVIPLNTERVLTNDMELIGDLSIVGDLTLLSLDSLTRPHLLNTLEDVTLNNGHDVIFCDASLNTVTVTLPAAASYPGKVYSIKALDTTYAVIVDANASETIDGSLTKTILLNSTLKIISDGTQWRIV